MFLKLKICPTIYQRITLAHSKSIFPIITFSKRTITTSIWWIIVYVCALTSNHCNFHINAVIFSFKNFCH